MIGVVIFWCNQIKFLKPIIDELGNDYILYVFDDYRGEKEYNRASMKNILSAAPDIPQNKIKTFSRRKPLASIVLDDVKTIICMEASLNLTNDIWFLKTNGVQVHSLQFFVDSLFIDNHITNRYIDVKYYTASAISKTKQEIDGSSNNHRLIGHPIYDPLDSNASGDNILVLLPNIRKETAFRIGGLKNYIDIIEKVSDNNNLVFKTRKKQWMPKEIQKFASDILFDENPMYPPTIAGALANSYMSVIFRSSSVYESVYGNNYVFNIEIDINERYGKIRPVVEGYFNSEIYNYDGVVESVGIDKMLRPDYNFVPRQIDQEAKHKWLDLFVGQGPGAKKIAEALSGTL